MARFETCGNDYFLLWLFTFFTTLNSCAVFKKKPKCPCPMPHSQVEMKMPESRECINLSVSNSDPTFRQIRGQSLNKWFAPRRFSLSTSHEVAAPSWATYRFDPKSKMSVVSVNQDLNLYSFSNHANARVRPLPRVQKLREKSKPTWRRMETELWGALLSSAQASSKCFPEASEPASYLSSRTKAESIFKWG